MMNTKGLNQLKAELIDWEQDITEAIAQELGRISRPVKFTEFSLHPFSSEVSSYFGAILLDHAREVVFDTLYADTDQKSLEQCMSDNELDSWDLLGLLDALKGIEN